MFEYVSHPHTDLKPIASTMDADKENDQPHSLSGSLFLGQALAKRSYLRSFSTNSKMTKSLRYSNSSTPTMSTRIGEGYSPAAVDNIQVSIEQKSSELDKLETAIMTLKTQRATQEFEIFKVEDKQALLEKQHGAILSLLTELDLHEQDSLLALNNKYELERKRHIQNHESGLAELKELITLEIEKVFDENMGRLVDEISKLRVRKLQLEQELVLLDQDLNRKLIKLKEDHNKRLLQLNQNLDESLAMLKDAIEQVTADQESKRKQLRELSEIKNSTVIPKNEELKRRRQTLQMEYGVKQKELGKLRDVIAHLTAEADAMKQTMIDMKKEIALYRDKSSELHTLMEHKEEIRRKLHNRLQELKGNIRVFCRIRPPCDEHKQLADIKLMEPQQGDDNPDMLIMVRKRTEDIYSSRQGSHKFLFDKVFASDLTNLDIFKEISQLVQSSLDGYNVCVFAYGQTGSGKTYTMAHDVDGMMPLSFNKIFEHIDCLRTHNWIYEVEGQFLEIYNEAVFDLLSASKITRSPSKSKLEIKHDDTNGTTIVTNSTSVSVTSANHAVSLLRRANSNRSTAYTKSNAHSSRSHSICMLRIRGYNQKTQETRSGALNLVDLAGSERLSHSQAQAERLKETQSINKSLSSLGDVITALKSRQDGKPLPHIPYRNSKLTYLLKNSLGGDCKTLMFVNIAPFSENVNETVNSLRFASKVNTTHQGTK